MLLATAALCLLPVAVLPQGASSLPDPAPRSGLEVSAAGGPVSKLPPARVEAIEVVISDQMAGLGIPGLSVAIAHEGELVFANGYGFADLENLVSARADTAYRLASISKAMTAVLALRLAEQGELDLDGPVRPRCPAFPEKRWGVTPRQLLSHRGGVRHYHDGEVPMTRRYTSLEEGLSLFKDDPLEFEPGTQYLYTTYGYSLLGCAIEGVTGRPFVDMLHESVFAPAGMTRTRPEDVRALIPNRARGYIRVDPGILINAALADMSYKVPGGGLSGTAPDVARFGLALISGRLLTPESLEEMLTPADQDAGDRRGYGLGMLVDEREGRREAWHGGGQEGVSTVLYFRPDGGPVVAVLTNLQELGPRLLALARNIADLVVTDPHGVK